MFYAMLRIRIYHNFSFDFNFRSIKWYNMSNGGNKVIYTNSEVQDLIAEQKFVKGILF